MASFSRNIFAAIFKLIQMCNECRPSGNEKNIHSHSIIQFENGYGLSIVKISDCVQCAVHYEVAVIKFCNLEDYTIVYPEYTNGDIVECSDYTQVESLINLTKML